MSKESIPKTNSFVIAGVLMIIAAVLSAYFGFIHLSFYRGSLISSAFVSVDYLSLYLGLLNSAAFGIALFAAMLLVLRKQAVLAEILVAIVVAFGLATPFIYVFYSLIHYDVTLVTFIDSWRWKNGLFWGLPLIAFSIPALILSRLNHRKSKNTNLRWKTLPLLVAGALMIALSIMSAYSGIMLMLEYQAGSTTIYARVYISELTVGVVNLLISGLSLLSGWLLLRRKQVDVAVLPIVLVFALGLAAPLLSSVGGFLENAALAYAPPTIAFSIAALLIIGLNRRQLKQDINAIASVKNQTLISKK